MNRLRTQLMLAGITASTFLAGSNLCHAQVRRYEPSRPTVSPYLNLFREQSGAIPNYQALVRPLQQQNELNRAQRAINQQNISVTQHLQSEVTQLQQQRTAQLQMSPTGKGSWFGQPSRVNRFFDTSDYYSQFGARQQSR